MSEPLSGWTSQSPSLGPGESVRLGPVYLETETLERLRFLDQAALAALPAVAADAQKAGWLWDDIARRAPAACYAIADSMLAERDRRRSESSAGSPVGDEKP